MHFSEIELSELSELLSRLTQPRHRINSNDLTMAYDHLSNYYDLINKVQELKRYLALPKFQGTETDSHQCKHCFQWTDEEARKDWVSVQDVLDRL